MLPGRSSGGSVDRNGHTNPDPCTLELSYWMRHAKCITPVGCITPSASHGVHHAEHVTQSASHKVHHRKNIMQGASYNVHHAGCIIQSTPHRVHHAEHITLGADTMGASHTGCITHLHGASRRACHTMCIATCVSLEQRHTHRHLALFSTEAAPCTATPKHTRGAALHGTYKCVTQVRHNRCITLPATCIHRHCSALMFHVPGITTAAQT